MKPFAWTPDNVSAKNTAAMSIRTYLEHRELRSLLEDIGPFKAVAEVGCGFGRMLPVLFEFAEHVVGFEREPDLVHQARRLLPAMEIIAGPNLAQALSDVANEDEFEFVMTFTVLQHMSNKAVPAVIDEIKRISSRYVLIVEDTDPDYRYQDALHKKHFTIGRSVETYTALMEPLTLTRKWVRPVEPGYKGQDKPFVGHYMLFEKTRVHSEIAPDTEIINAVLQQAKPVWPTPNPALGREGIVI